MASLQAGLISALLTIAAFIPVITIVVFFHELGHLLVGRWRGVKPEKFSIGFGPKLFGFMVGETEVRVSLLPLGGYVKFAGDNPLEQPKPEDKGRGFYQATPVSRGLIAVAGPVANFILAFVIFCGLFLTPQRVLAPMIGFVKPGSPAAQAGLLPRDRIDSIDGAKVGTFSDLQEIVQESGGKPIKLGITRAGAPMSIVITPALVEEKTIIETVKHGRIGISPLAREPVVAPLASDGPAAKAGLLPLDRITSFNGQKVENYDELTERIAALLSRKPDANVSGTYSIEGMRPREVKAPGGTLWAQDPIRLSISLPALGRTVTTPEVETLAGLGCADMNLFVVEPASAADVAGLKRGDRILSVEGKTATWWTDVEEARLARGLEPMQMEVLRNGTKLAVTVHQFAKKQLDEAGVRVEVPEFGAAPDPQIDVGEPPYVRIQYGPVEALRHASKAMIDSTRMIALGIGGIASGRISTEALGGPVMIAQVARKAAGFGLAALLALIASISVNLGLMNLIPLPVLDGFHVFSAILERIRHRPLSIRVVEYANMVGLAALLALMVFAFKNDVVRTFFQN